MGDFFKEFILSQANILEIKGKYAPIQDQDGIQEVECIWVLAAVKQNLPVLFIKIQKKYFIGVTLARQSSDLLGMIGKKVIKNHWKSKIPKYLIQYRLPKDLNSLKLILYCEWAEFEEYEKIISQLVDIQEYFQKSIEKIADLIL